MSDPSLPGWQADVSSAAITLILIAALAHASWNLLSKQAAAVGTVCFSWLIGLCATVIYAPAVLGYALVTAPRLTAMNWVFLVGTGLLHCGYFLFLQFGYRLGDLSAVYPAGRGTGAALACAGGIVVLGERPGPLALAGVAAIIAGIVLLGVPGRASAPAPAAMAFAIATGALIACYTLWDSHAVAVLRTPAPIQGFASFAFVGLALAPSALRRRRQLADLWSSYRGQVLGAAVLSPLAYLLILVAMSFTAVSLVAPAREVSVLIGVVLGRRMLGEGAVRRRLVGAAAIVAGVIAIAL